MADAQRNSGSQSSDAAASEQNQKTGAEALKRLLRTLQRLNEETACLADDGGSDGGPDTRDYVAMSREIERCLQENLLDAERGRREGFTRSLADLLSITADGCCLADLNSWDPIETTELSFSGRLHELLENRSKGAGVSEERPRSEASHG